MEIALYAFGIMYSPGPVNILGFNAGLTGIGKYSTGYFLGVGAAMFSWFIVLGYIGEAIIYSSVLPYIALIGSIYILCLACKMFFSNIDVRGTGASSAILNFKDGYMLQALNPKGMLVILPITTIMFPAAHVTGFKILIYAALISIAAVGAPGSYSVAGAIVGKRLRNAKYFGLFNKAMGLMLIIVAFSIFYDFFIRT